MKIRADITIFNVYKPPTRNWNCNFLRNIQHSGMCIGDFNSNSSEWVYIIEDENGEKLVNRPLLGYRHLEYDAK